MAVVYSTNKLSLPKIIKNPNLLMNSNDNRSSVGGLSLFQGISNLAILKSTFRSVKVDHAFAKITIDFD